MLMTGPIKCPMCQKDHYSLKYWKDSDGVYFNLCDFCIDKNKDEFDLLRIGYAKGREEYRQQMLDTIHKEDQ